MGYLLPILLILLGVSAARTGYIILFRAGGWLRVRCDLYTRLAAIVVWVLSKPAVMHYTAAYYVSRGLNKHQIKDALKKQTSFTYVYGWVSQ